MDLTAFFKMSYGLYVVSAQEGERRAACLINTAVQVTAEPPRISVTVNKENVTADVIADAGSFTVTAVDETADMPYLGNFGFRTSANYDKFEKYASQASGLGNPYCPEHACAVFDCKLVDTVDVGTHYLFIGEVVGAERLGDAAPMTYSYYHTTLKRIQHERREEDLQVRLPSLRLRGRGRHARAARGLRVPRVRRGPGSVRARGGVGNLAQPLVGERPLLEGPPKGGPFSVDDYLALVGYSAASSARADSVHPVVRRASMVIIPNRNPISY